MRSFKDILNEVEATRGQFITEANVLNVDLIDRYVKTIANGTKPEEGKAWFLKKARAHIINTPELLNPVQTGAIASMANVPDWAQAAAERGEQLYTFSHADPKMREFQEHLYHLKDWFNALYDVSKREAKTPVQIEDKTLAARELTKINKLNVAQALQRADEWFAHMGTRLAGAKSLEGVEVVHEWDDGYYAVRFTTKEAMVKDGRELQNCLANAYYWEPVAKGEQIVWSIRKPNDEAVVGIRATVRRSRSQPAFTPPGEKPVGPKETLKLNEVKGKNNKPVAPQYRQYCIDLLQKLNVDSENVYDMKAAGIYVMNGKWGTFEDVAEVIFDNNGVKIWRTQDEWLAHLGSATNVTKGTIARDHIASMEYGPQDVPTLIGLLNALGLPPDQTFYKNNLVTQAIYYNNSTGKYGSAREIGTHIGTVDGIDLIQVKGSVIGFRGEDPIAFMDYSDDKYIMNVKARNGNAPVSVPQWMSMLNAIGMKPSYHLELQFQRSNLYWDGKKYGRINQVGVKEFTNTDEDGEESVVYRLGKRKVWILFNGYGDISRFAEKGGVFKSDDENERNANPADVRKLVDKYRFKKVGPAYEFGILNSSVGAVASKETFMENLEAITAGWRAPDDDVSPKRSEHMIPWRLSDELESFLIHQSRDNAEFTPEDQERLYRAFAANPKHPAAIEESVKPAQLYDMTIRYYDMFLPLAVFEVFDTLGLDAPKQARADLRRAVEYCVAFIKKNPYNEFSFGNYSRMTERKTGVSFEDLHEVMSEAQRLLDEKKRERRDNPDKYATDLSSRFAALNALRKKR